MILSGISASIACCVIVGLILGIMIGRAIFSGGTITNTLTQFVSKPGIFGFKIHSNDSPFIDALGRTTSKIQDVVQGSMCNVLHDPSIMEQVIKNSGDTDTECSVIMANLVEQREMMKKELNISEKTLESDSDITKIKTIFYNEMVQLEKDIMEKYCPTGTERVRASDFKKMVENARKAVCDKYDITPKTFKQFVDDTVEDVRKNSPLGKIYSDDDFELIKKDVGKGNIAGISQGIKKTM
jgi:hypothetical protein